MFSNPARSVWSVPSISEAVLGLVYLLVLSHDLLDAVGLTLFYSCIKSRKAKSKLTPSEKMDQSATPTHTVV